MKSYYLSEKEYKQVLTLLKASDSQAILYHGLIFELSILPPDCPGEDPINEICCAYAKDILAREYEWFFVPNPADYR